jgi:HEAT repeat protein
MAIHSYSRNEAIMEKIRGLVKRLNDDDWKKRHQAREDLEKIGEPATPMLIESLSHPEQRVRWEAAKALVAISAPEAAPALAKSLMDDNFEVKWLAAEALIALQQEGLSAVLQGLIDNPDSVSFKHGAHHVLHDLNEKGLLNEEIRTVMDELRETEIEEAFPMTVRKALDSLHAKEGVKRDNII